MHEQLYGKMHTYHTLADNRIINDRYISTW